MSLNDAKRELQKNCWFRVQNRAKNNFLHLCLHTYLAWIFLFLCPFLSNYPWTFGKKSFFNKLWAWKVGIKQKIRGCRVKSWPNVAPRQLQSRKKVHQKYTDIACKAKFFPSYLTQAAKFMLQHPTMWFDRKQSKYSSKELLLYEFLHRKSTDVGKTVTNSACIPLCQ